MRMANTDDRMYEIRMGSAGKLCGLSLPLIKGVAVNFLLDNSTTSISCAALIRAAEYFEWPVVPLYFALAAVSIGLKQSNLRKALAADTAARPYYLNQEASALHLPVILIEVAKSLAVTLPFKILPAMVAPEGNFKILLNEALRLVIINCGGATVYTTVINFLTSIYSIARDATRKVNGWERLALNIGAVVPPANPTDGLIVPLFDMEAQRFYNNSQDKSIGRWADFQDTIHSLFRGCGRSASQYSTDELNELLVADPSIDTAWMHLTPRITWLKHACVLIEVRDKRFLFDPSNGFVKPCFQAKTRDSLPLDKMPRMHGLFATHNHADHFNNILDRALHNPTVFAGKGSKEWLQSNGFTNVIEMEWWWSRPIYDRDGTLLLTVHFVPAEHSSQTSATDSNKMLWGGWVIEAGSGNNKTFIYLSGDTASGNKMIDAQGRSQQLFVQLHRRFPQIDIAFIGIGPSGFASSHMNYNQAIMAMLDLKPRYIVGYHHGSYWFGEEEEVQETAQKFYRAAKQHAELDGKVFMFKAGATFVPDELQNPAVLKGRLIAQSFLEDSDEESDDEQLQSLRFAIG